MGQRRFRLALADSSLPTESGEQHYEPNHGRPKIVRISTENDRKSIENRSTKIVAKSLFDGEGDKNRPWTAFGTMLWTPKSRPGRSKSALGMQKAPGERLWACQGRSKTRLESPWAEIGAHLSWRASPKTLVDRFSEVFATKFQCFFRTLVGRFSIVFCDCSLIAFQSLFRSVSWSRGKSPRSVEP